MSRLAALVERMRPKIEAQMAADIPLICEALRQGDARQARFLAHRLRSTVGVVGHDEMAQMLAAIEEANGIYDPIPVESCFARLPLGAPIAPMS